MTIQTDNLIQQTDLLSLMKAQKSNVQTYTDNNVGVSFDNVLSNLKTLNNEARDIEKDITNKKSSNNSKKSETTNKTDKNSKTDKQNNVNEHKNSDEKIKNKDVQIKDEQDTKISKNKSTKNKDNDNKIKNNENSNKDTENIKQEENIVKEEKNTNDNMTSDKELSTKEAIKDILSQETQNLEITDDCSDNIFEDSESLIQTTDYTNEISLVQNLEEESLNQSVEVSEISLVQNLEEESLNQPVEVSEISQQIVDVSNTPNSVIEENSDILNINQNITVKSENTSQIVSSLGTTDNTIQSETGSGQIDVSNMELTNDLETFESEALDSLKNASAEKIETEIIEGITENTDVEESTSSVEKTSTKDNSVKTKNDPNIKETEKIVQNTQDDNKDISDLIDEIDVEQDVPQTKNAILKDNLTESILKSQIATSAQTTDTNNIMQQRTAQNNLQQALQSNVNVQNVTVDTQQNTQSNMNFSQNSSTQTQTPAVQQAGATAPTDTAEQISSQFSKISQSATKMNTQAQNLNKTDVLNQVTTKFEQLKDTTTSKVNIILRPEKLGKVGVELVSRPDGVSARILADTQQVKELLDKNIDTLKNSLQTQGVNVNNISIKVVESAQNSEMNFSQNFDFTNQEQQNKQEKLSAETNSDLSGSKHNEDNDEEQENTVTNNYLNEDEQDNELQELERLYKRHLGNVDLVV